MPWLRNRPPGRSSRVHRLHVGIELGPPDVLVHADARDLVERRLVDLAVVEHAHLGAVGQARPPRSACARAPPAAPRASRRVRARRGGPRRAGRASPSRSRCRAGARPAAGAACGRSARACAPARARASRRRPRSRRRSRPGSARAAARRSGSRRRSDGGTEARSRRSECSRPAGAASEAGIGGRRSARGPGDAQGRGREPRTPERPEREAADPLAQAEHALEIAVDVQSARDPGPAETELVGRAQEVRDRLLVAYQHDRRIGVVARDDRAAVPEAHRHAAVARARRRAPSCRRPSTATVRAPRGRRAAVLPDPSLRRRRRRRRSLCISLASPTAARTGAGQRQRHERR